MSEFNFKSQICTSREQSERLLALGLKKETADMCYKVTTHDFKGNEINEKDRHYTLCCWYDESSLVCGLERKETIPAWSLHRLLCMIPNILRAEKPFENSFSSLMNIVISTLGIAYYYEDYDENRIYEFECFGNLMEASVDAIEWLIKEGYFPKEYLEE